MTHYRWPIEPRRVGEPPVDVATVNPAGGTDPAHYVPHPELVDAVNVALLLGLPLLVTGEPGTGKTQLAASIAYQLGYNFDDRFKFVAKSTSQARDLLYRYDALGRFHAAEMARLSDTAIQERTRARDAVNFVEYGPLGRAILLAHDRDAPGLVPFYKPEERRRAPPTGSPDDLMRGRIGHSGRPSRSVVLIDEIDKAPRDFTNDLLFVIETMQFQAPEVTDAWTPLLGDRKHWPVLIITSNSERPLPDAFMRRCIYFHLPFPDRRPESRHEEDPSAPLTEYFIEDIVSERLDKAFGASQLVADAIDLFYYLRNLQPRLRKPPATAELLNWLVALREAIRAGQGRTDQRLEQQRALIRLTATTLLKSQEDRERGLAAVEQWVVESRGS